MVSTMPPTTASALVRRDLGDARFLAGLGAAILRVARAKRGTDDATQEDIAVASVAASSRRAGVRLPRMRAGTPLERPNA